MIRFSHEANSWMMLIQYSHYPNLNKWINVSPDYARTLVDSGFTIEIDC
jgi:hypothetical protein